MYPVKLASCMAENTERFCQALTRFLENRLRIPFRYVGGIPWQERERLFDIGEIQILWICGLPYIEKTDATPDTLELLAVPVPRGERYQGRPVYFSDIVVRRDRSYRSFVDLRGASWAYNEPRSHSGFNVLRAHVAQCSQPGDFFGTMLESGAHSVSLQMIVSGKADAAAIDSTVLDWLGMHGSSLIRHVRVIETLGPSPIPPFVVTKRLPSVLRADIRRILLRMEFDPFGRMLLERSGLQRFLPGDDRDYDPIRTMARTAAEVSFLNFS
jgi:phosphonate transport system substrate-binding protein